MRGAWAQMVGEPGRGVPTIIEMVGHTRLDCVIGTAAGMRAAVAQATWHAAHRGAFGATLIDQPLMRNVLADLAIESEAATVAGDAPRRAPTTTAERDAHFKRLATAVGKYYVCKRVPGHAYEALECLGGNGYVEESGMPRLYREAPLASIWEGSGNVMALDVLRALARSPEALEAFFAEVDLAAGADARLDAFAGDLRDRVRRRRGDRDPRAADRRAMALALQGSLLVRHAPPAVADAFCAARLGRRQRPELRHAAGRRRRGGDHRAPHAGLRRAPEPAESLTGDREALTRCDDVKRADAERSSSPGCSASASESARAGSWSCSS